MILLAFFTGFMFDLTQSYTLSFVLGGALCIASAIIMIHPYFYVQKHLKDIVLDIPEKEALTSSIEFSDTQYSSILNVSRKAVSLDIIQAINKFGSMDHIKDANNLGSADILPATKRLKELKTFQSTASV